ncbi:hypothetical protein DSO57_1002446 [Entomophthora muscae]|uniref:Uncharacterized protein n=1 Tax=Entomophthora muscae TaxID=34485 RepID=A0ACC2RZY6_9FUNG|nr:hypothetical protein DSO57_1002446 [Entomophthora muscae]
MRPLFILMHLAALVARLHPTPIELYVAKNANIYKEVTLSPEDGAQLSMLVAKNENLLQLVNGKIAFDTSFLNKYKETPPELIVKNYLRRMDLKVLNNVHNILGFFYENDRPIALGPALANLTAADIDIKECMYEILVWWLDSTPGGKLNTHPMLARLQGGALDAELMPFLTQTANSIRRFDRNLLKEIETVIKTAQEDFTAFPDPLYNTLTRLVATR